MSAMRVNLPLICAAALSVFVATPHSLAGPSVPLFLQNPDGGAVRALVIGIDAYQHVRPLKGSVAYAHYIEGALRTMGTNDIVTLMDEQATRINVLRNISDL